MTAPGEWRCDAAALPPGRTAVFRLTCGGRTVHGFVVNHEGRAHAYVNSCPHVGTPLDLWPNEFLDEDGRTLVCATHGALFAPDTGFCLAGPCAGDRLEPLPVRADGDQIVVGCAQA
jgi:nitrite reductase/ring-hydroxylating ferredoxin subunit